MDEEKTKRIHMEDVYWRKMYTFRFQLEYLNLCYRHCVIIRRVVLIGVAVCSSTAIAAWANNADCAKLWGSIILISQVISAVYEILPIRKRTEVLAALISQLDDLYIEIEKTWNDIQILDISDGKINEEIYRFEKKWNSLANKDIEDNVMSQRKSLTDKANSKTDIYMKNVLEEAMR